MAGKDPLMSALMNLKKRAPDDVKSDKALMAGIAQIEKSIKAKDPKYKDKIAVFVKQIGAAKKKASKKKDALKVLSEMEKAAKKDEKERLKGARDKSTKPS